MTILREKNFANEIKPQSALIDFKLNEIWRYRDLVTMFVKRDLVTLYKQTILGPLWYLIQPILTSIVFTVIFGKVAEIPTDGLPPMLFYLAGITAWNYFAESFKNTSDTFKKNENIFGKVYFPRVVMPLSIVISGLLKFGIQLLLFIGFILYFWYQGVEIVPIWYKMWLIPFLLLMMGFLGLGFGMIISSLTTKYRDLVFLIQFGIQLLMYTTPVIYPLSSIPEKYRWAIEANPVSSIIETFRYIFLGEGTFSWNSLLYSTVFTLVLMFFAMIVFNRTEKNFMDTV
jgi:lipopolysaccharide transport system permease protein